jgi:hypothetical protein
VQETHTTGLCVMCSNVPPVASEFSAPTGRSSCASSETARRCSRGRGTRRQTCARGSPPPASEHMLDDAAHRNGVLRSNLKVIISENFHQPPSPQLSRGLVPEGVHHASETPARGCRPSLGVLQSNWKVALEELPPAAQPATISIGSHNSPQPDPSRLPSTVEEPPPEFWPPTRQAEHPK